MRQVVYDILNVAPITSLVPGGIHQRHTMTELPQIPSARFMVFGLRRSAPSRAKPGAKTGVTVWVYDEGGDYTKIDETLAEVKNQLESAVGTPTNKLILFQWAEDNQDDYDPGFQRIFKSASFTIVHKT